MNILILGSGGREHAIAWKMHNSPLCEKLFVAPGNAGTQQVAVNIDLDIMDFASIEEEVNRHHVDMLIVGPEAPLVAGIADYFEENMPELKVVGPKKEGALLEGSKSFAKRFMKEYGIPTAAYLEVTNDNIEQGLAHIAETNGPYVLKADGLAAGKGVLILHERERAAEELKNMLGGKFGEASHTVVIEEFLDGIEFSAFVVTDGQYYALLPLAKDYKRIGEGDTGLNTGGMGAISPVNFVTKPVLDKVRKEIILPTLDGLNRRNIDYVGFIFFGLILVGNQPNVIEYNCRMGDPETQVVMARLETDFAELLNALFTETLYEVPITKSKDCAAAVVLVSGGYPGDYKKGLPISGLDDFGQSVVFHAGTKSVDDKVVTNGGRVLAVTCEGTNISQAIASCNEKAERIKFMDKYFRRDIGFDLKESENKN